MLYRKLESVFPRDSFAYRRILKEFKKENFDKRELFFTLLKKGRITRVSNQEGMSKLFDLLDFLKGEDNWDISYTISLNGNKIIIDNFDIVVKYENISVKDHEDFETETFFIEDVFVYFTIYPTFYDKVRIRDIRLLSKTFSTNNTFKGGVSNPKRISSLKEAIDNLNSNLIKFTHPHCSVSYVGALENPTRIIFDKSRPCFGNTKLSELYSNAKYGEGLDFDELIIFFEYFNFFLESESLQGGAYWEGRRLSNVVQNGNINLTSTQSEKNSNLFFPKKSFYLLLEYILREDIFDDVIEVVPNFPKGVEVCVKDDDFWKPLFKRLLEKVKNSQSEKDYDLFNTLLLVLEQVNNKNYERATMIVRDLLDLNMISIEDTPIEDEKEIEVETTEYGEPFMIFNKKDVHFTLKFNNYENHESEKLSIQNIKLSPKFKKNFNKALTEIYNSYLIDLKNGQELVNFEQMYEMGGKSFLRVV